MSKPRNKAWLGAIIGGVTTGINLLMQQKAAEQQAELQKQQVEEQNRQNAINNAINLTNKYSNDEYIKTMNDKIVFRNGGAVYKDRIKNLKKFKCGGKKR